MQPIFHWRAARHLTVLAYHGIDDPQGFDDQLDYLVRTMHPVSVEELLAAIAGQRGLPKSAVLITFDDGDRSIIEVVMPMLRDRGLTGIAFVVSGLLNTNQPYWWSEVEALVRNGGVAHEFAGLPPAKVAHALTRVSDQQRLAVMAQLRQTATGTSLIMPQLRGEELRQLESAGITIGNHTFTHPCLHQCSDHKIEIELSQAHKILSEILGRAPQVFAYPNGDVDHRAIKVLKELGYTAAFLFDHYLSVWPPPDPLRISRVRVNSYTSLDRFRIIVSGLHPALHHAQGRA